MKEEFINKLKPHVLQGWCVYKILPSLTIAQAILETGWGKSSLGNNLFGIKADKNWTGRKQLSKTTEYVGGKLINVDAWFRDYDSIYESLEDRYKFLQAKRYSKVVGETNYKKASEEIYKAGYATDPLYSTKLIQIIEQNKLYEIDKLAIGIYRDSDVSSWAKASWEFCKNKGLLDGNRPKDNLLREEMAEILRRLL